MEALESALIAGRSKDRFLAHLRQEGGREGASRAHNATEGVELPPQLTSSSNNGGPHLSTALQPRGHRVTQAYTELVASRASGEERTKNKACNDLTSASSCCAERVVSI